MLIDKFTLGNLSIRNSEVIVKHCVIESLQTSPLETCIEEIFSGLLRVERIKTSETILGIVAEEVLVFLNTPEAISSFLMLNSPSSDIPFCLVLESELFTTLFSDNVTAFVITAETACNKVCTSSLSDSVDCICSDSKHVVTCHWTRSTCYRQLDCRLCCCEENVSITHQDEWLIGLTLTDILMFHVRIKILTEVETCQCCLSKVVERTTSDYAGRGGRIFAECGGMMYLCRSIETDGRCHAMAGVLPLEATMDGARLTLGYRTMTYNGRQYRGHEFHYSRLKDAAAVPSQSVLYNARGMEVPVRLYRMNNVIAGYTHWYWGEQDFMDFWK